MIFFSINQKERSKLKSKNILNFFVGYVTKSCKMWILFERQMCINKDVLVVESSPQLQATNPTNRTQDDEDQQNNNFFQSKVVIENPLLKRWN